MELAICATLLIVIAFGIIEFGNAWNRKLEVETAARAGARVGSSLGNDRTADKGLLQATISVLGDFGLTNVNYVVVYKSTTADGKRQGTCAEQPAGRVDRPVQRVHGRAAPEPELARLHERVHRQQRLGGGQELVSDRPSERAVGRRRLPRRVRAGELRHRDRPLQVAVLPGRRVQSCAWNRSRGLMRNRIERARDRVRRRSTKVASSPSSSRSCS